MKFLDNDCVAEFSEADDGSGGVFFLESHEIGNFVWYKKDNVIIPHNGPLREFLDMTGSVRAYCRGRKVIKDFCGSNVRIVN